MITGGCHCGALRYQADGEALTHALCHCTDCRRHAGAPMVGWTMYPQHAVKVTKGTPKVYLSSEHGRRHFCPDCGTGLFYTNAEMLPGIIDIQSATYDDPELRSGASAHSGRRTDQMDGARSRTAGVRALPATGVILWDTPPRESLPRRVTIGLSRPADSTSALAYSSRNAPNVRSRSPVVLWSGSEGQSLAMSGHGVGQPVSCHKPEQRRGAALRRRHAGPFSD